MLRLFRKKPSASTSRQTKPTRQRTSPLDLIELREHIFSYLDTTDLRRSVLPVCREWFWMHRHLFERVTIWESNLNSPISKRTINSLNGSGRLYWHYSKGAYVRHQDPQWTDLVRALKKNHSRYRQMVQRNERLKPSMDEIRAAIFDHPLRHLDFIAFQNLDRLLPSILPSLGFLTTLRLRSHTFGHVSIDSVLKACPLLENLQAGMLGVILELPEPWVSTNQKSAGSIRLSLRSLELVNATFEYSSLTGLLAVCPMLKDLQLINIMFNERISPVTRTTMDAGPQQRKALAPYITPQTFDPDDLATGLVECLKSLQLRLQSFHISVYASHLPDLKPGTLLPVCPEATKWTFWTRDLTKSIVQHLTLVPNNVTELDLLCDGVGGGHRSSLLHEYLCESPHLLHLRAPKIRFPVKHWDLYNRLFKVMESWGPERVYPAGVWRCRKLKSLHMHFWWSNNINIDSSNAVGRVVFGYLSRVCPHLEDLQLTSRGQDTYESRLWVGLEGGFCLLSSLRYLKNLHIGSVDYHYFNTDIWELSWMTASGFNLDHRRARQIRMTTWDTKICGEEARMEDEVNRVNEAEIYAGTMESEAGLRKELRELGRISDVKTRLEQIDSGQFMCWPSLERISIYHNGELGRHPDAEMKRLFP